MGRYCFVQVRGSMTNSNKAAFSQIERVNVVPTRRPASTWTPPLPKHCALCTTPSPPFDAQNSHIPTPSYSNQELLPSYHPLQHGYYILLGIGAISSCLATSSTNCILTSYPIYKR